ncbi:hypothetical protein SAMN05216276_1008171 [Streptosporangium subroseum]|uniref:Uncharacterized protein n=2 Tax=Streptosporangium subroseum TaxID=106412 RepID=A0A239E2Z3_9ACTN|nr:hypothetical protein SAMN05216276_1008171 [Streptosporangium subroseum]
MLTHTTSGVRVMRQAYADGYIYEYKVPNGVSIYPETPHLATPLFRGRLLRTFFDGECNYITVWMSRLPAVDFMATPTVEYETLHEDEHLVVSRLRFENGEDGWIYRVQSQLGHPWPRLPCLAPTLTAPIVAMDRTDMDITVRYWVKDSETGTAAA